MIILSGVYFNSTYDQTSTVLSRCRTLRTKIFSTWPFSQCLAKTPLLPVVGLPWEKVIIVVNSHHGSSDVLHWKGFRISPSTAIWYMEEEIYFNSYRWLSHIVVTVQVFTKCFCEVKRRNVFDLDNYTLISDYMWWSCVRRHKFCSS